jgi:hypothetical protein
MNTLSFEMMSANQNDWTGKFYEIIQATENVKDLIVCHFIKLNELLKRINVFKKQSNYDWIHSKQKIAIKSEFYYYLRLNTRILKSEFNELNKDFLLYKDTLDQFKITVMERDIPIANEYKDITLDKLLNGDLYVIPDPKKNPLMGEVYKYESASTDLSIDILNNTYQYNYDLFDSVKASHEGIFLQADTIIKDMRKQF